METSFFSVYLNIIGKEQYNFNTRIRFNYEETYKNNYQPQVNDYFNYKYKFEMFTLLG